MNIFKHFALVSLLYCGMGLSAFERGTEFNLTNGYRNDELQRTNRLESTDPIVSQKDHIKIDNINLYQLGLNFRSMPHFDDCENLSYLNNFFINGFAYWGWGGSGATLHEHIKSYVYDVEQLGRAKLKNACTQDYQIGLGYMFDCDCWNLSLSGGYAYDKQVIHSNHGEIAFPASAPFVDAAIYGKGYKTTTTWQGPWVGTELFYDLCDWRLSLGYEFHFAHYHANHTIPANATSHQQGMSSSTKSSRAYGNIGFISGRYFFCEGWELGLMFKYQNWQANHGHLDSSYFVNNGYSLTTTSSATGKWISYGLNFDIGYAF